MVGPCSGQACLRHRYYFAPRSSVPVAPTSLKIRLVLSCCILLAFAVASRAEALVNPRLHTAASPENLVIEILERQTESQGAVERNRLLARVVEVGRSKTGLKPGDEIAIIYERDLRRLEEIDKWFERKAREPGWAGETPDFLPSAPAAGKTVRAYLRLTAPGGQRSYEPAAGQYSFEAR